jgi:hypothetical protein
MPAHTRTVRIRSPMPGRSPLPERWLWVVRATLIGAGAGS